MSKDARYPPEFAEQQLEYLLDQARDWQITNGLSLKYREDEFVRSVPIGISLRPLLFPKTLFDEALFLQTLYSELYMRVAADPDWLHNALKDDIEEEDSFASILWNVHQRAVTKGYVQDLSLGIFRSDYMLQAPSTADGMPSLKQVEFNTHSVAGVSHACKVARLHHYLNDSGSYGDALSNPSLPNPSSLIANDNIQTLASALATAHHAYGPQRNPSAKALSILFVIQPNNINICDERPIEYLLSSSSHFDPPIPVHRLEFATGQPILSHTTLGPSRELLFHHPSIPNLTHEISVVYFRAGYEPSEYPLGIHGTGFQARCHLESSLAIKCPNILGHMTTFKSVQAALTLPTNIERFLPSPRFSSADRQRLISTFMPIYPLTSPQAVRLALDPETAKRYVLKPSTMEGGGHNIFREDIPAALRNAVPEEEWKRYVLMELIEAPTGQRGVLVGTDGEGYVGETVSELGILGTCLWRTKIRESPQGKGDGGEKGRTERMVEVVQNDGAVGWTLKTKPRDVDEMSVVKGYGCFDSLALY